MKSLFLITKDCMSIEALPIYGGGKFWCGKMPNIDELATKGTVFNRHYCAAPSTAMSMSAMLTGKYPFEFIYRNSYVNVKPSNFPSIFDYFQKECYECHVIWDQTWINMAWRFVREFGDENKTIFHNLDIAQATSAHKMGDEKLKRNDELLCNTISQISKTINGIDYTKKQFVWMHLPHILKGRCSYMDDMDVFDDIVGIVREIVGDDNIFISSDHGHMNMHKHKIGYGFDLYEPAIRIPLVTPRLEGKEFINYITSNIDLPNIIINRKLPPKRQYVISDTKYYAQPNRKLSIISDKYKYIFNAKDGSEELYDLLWDPLENFNILETLFYDVDRKQHIFLIEKYFYPYYEEAMRSYPFLKSMKQKIWKTGSIKERSVVRIRNIGGNIIRSIKQKINYKK